MHIKRFLIRADEPFPGGLMHLAIVIPLSGKSAHEVTDLQLSIARRHGRHAGLESSPHVTLKLGFSAAGVDEFETLLARIVAETPPLMLRVEGFDFFEEGIAFLDVKPQPELVALRLRILRELQDRHGVEPLEIEGSGFRFHVTLASGLPRHSFEQLRRELRPLHAGFDFSAGHLEILCHIGSHWIVCRKIKLRGVPQDSSGCMSSGKPNEVR